MTLENVSELPRRRPASRPAPPPREAAACAAQPQPAGGDAQDCLARLASGVAIAACATPRGPEGVLVCSVTALSPRPPRILFCVRKVEAAHAALLAAETISLSILSSDQRVEAERFEDARLKTERFDAGWRTPQDAPPRLTGALAWAEGRVRTRIDAGSHTIFILDVIGAEVGPGAPLVYFESGFLAPAAG